jgi:catechol 2,3-dioxygenase-like lactoylglutathione lyase family enzyme
MRIRNVALKTRDVAAQRAFWSETLGLPGSAADDAWRVHLARGGIVFEPAAPGTDPRYHYAIAIPRGRVDEAADWLAARVSLLEFHHDADAPDGATRVRFPTGCAATYFLDATGSVVELASCDAFARVRGRFAVSMLWSVCEIGLAVADPGAAREVLCRSLNQPVYWGGATPADLVAIGNVEGALLVSPIGRGWIPIGLPADPWPTRVTTIGAAAVSVALPDGPHVIDALPGA